MFLDQFIRDSQAYQARFIQFHTEYYRRHKFNPCNGAHLFCFNDCWPAITGSVIGYDRKPKEGFFALQRAMAPLQAFLEISGDLLCGEENEAVIWRGPLIGRAIKQFWEDVTWGNLHYLIVDLPPGTSDAALTVMQSIPLDGVVLVTSPQDLAGMVVRKAARMAQQMGAPILGLVENMSYVTCPECGEKIEVFGPSQALRTTMRLGLSLLGRLPLDPELALHCDAGEIEQYAARLFEPIAEKVAEQVPTPKSVPVS